MGISAFSEKIAPMEIAPSLTAVFLPETASKFGAYERNFSPKVHKNHFHLAKNNYKLTVWELAAGQLLALVTLDAQPICIAVSPTIDTETGAITIVTGDAAGAVYCFTFCEAEED